MEKFLRLFRFYKTEKQSLELTFTWDKVADYCLTVYHGDSKTTVVDLQDQCLATLTAKAFTELAEWGKEFAELEDIVYNEF